MVGSMHRNLATAKVSTFVVSDFCIVRDFSCLGSCIGPQESVGYLTSFAGIQINYQNEGQNLIQSLKPFLRAAEILGELAGQIQHRRQLGLCAYAGRDRQRGAGLGLWEWGRGLTRHSPLIST